MMHVLQSISTSTAVAISRSNFPASDFFELRYSLETFLILRDPALKWKEGLFPPPETLLKELELLCQLLSRIWRVNQGKCFTTPVTQKLQC